MSIRKIYVSTEAGKRKIGELKDGVFTSFRKYSKHYYKKLNAWGIDHKALTGMIDNEGLHTVVIHDKDTGYTYTTKAENFINQGTILHHKPHRVQIFLPLDYWDISVLS